MPDPIPKRSTSNSVPMTKSARMAARTAARSRPPAVPTWCAAGLSLAVIGTAAFNGLGALCSALLVAVVIVALTRLHGNAADKGCARTTTDLIGAVLGPVSARFAGLVQLAAYAALGVGAAVSLGLQPLAMFGGDPETVLTGWMWPVCAGIGVIAAGAIVAVLPTRTIMATVAVLAGLGLLAYFYLALAVIAKMASGSPQVIGGAENIAPLDVLAAALPLSLGLFGFEAPTVASDRMRSVARPLGAAVAVTAVCAVALLVAVNMSTIVGFSHRATDLPVIVTELFGDAGRLSLNLGTALLGVAVVLATMWAATRVAARLFGGGVATAAAVPAVIFVLAVLACRFPGAIGELMFVVPALLLMVLYVVVGEANARVEGSLVAMQLPRAALIVVLSAVLLMSVRTGHFVLGSTMPLILAAVITAGAAIFARTTPRPARLSR